MKPCDKCDDYPGIKQEKRGYSWTHNCGDTVTKGSNHSSVKAATKDWNKTVRSSGTSAGCFTFVIIIIVVICGGILF